MSDWGTQFPTNMDAVLAACEKVEIHDGDIYEVKVELDNGDWRVDIKYTDWELEKFTYTLYVNRHGSPLKVDEQR